MLTLLSPAKSLDYETPLPTRKHSEPRLLSETSQLVEVMATKSPTELQALMSISDELANLNFERYQMFGEDGPARAAVLAFAGDVYQGMDRFTFTERDFTAAQKQIRILSGLYGVLRPLDLIHPHRLEMGTKLSTIRGDTLYDFWGSRITDLLRADIEERSAKAVVNLASAEYASSVQLDDLGVPVITPVFKDANKGGYRVISFFAKRARGMMASWMVRERVATRKAIRSFGVGGYRYSEADSTTTAPVFLRD